MTLEEITGAAEKRVKHLKYNAKSAKDRARQLKINADINAEQLKQRQSRDKLAQLHKKTVGAIIKPYV